MYKAKIGNDKFRLYDENGIVPVFEGAGLFQNQGTKVKLNALPSEMTESAGYSGIVKQGITKTASNFTNGGRYIEVALETPGDVTQMLVDTKTKGQFVSKWAWVPEVGLFYIQIGNQPDDLTDKQMQSVIDRDNECRQNIEETLLDASVFASAS